MLKSILKTITVSVFLLGILMYPDQSAKAALNCSLINGNPEGDQSIIFRMTSNTNAHFGRYDSTNYGWKLVCDKGGINVGRDCSVANFDKIFNISSNNGPNENAHVEDSNNFSNYAAYTCLSSDYPVDVRFADNVCPAGYTDMVSVSGGTNAHLGRFDIYTKKVCAKIDSPVPPAAPTLNSVTPMCVGSDPGFTISWTNVSGEDNYEIYRKPDGGSYDKIFSPPKNATSYSDSDNLAAGITYVYYVRAVNAAGGSDSGEKSATAKSCAFKLTVESSGASNVSITDTSSPPSNYGGTTLYSISSIASGTVIALTAPATVGVNNFSGWNGCDNVSGVGSRTCNVTMDADKNITAGYVPGGQGGSYTLFVNSAGASGVSITGSPNAYTGTTNYSKPSIASGTVIALTAPATAGGNNFSSWTGCDSVNGTVCNVTMNADKDVTANYTPPAATYTLFVKSSGASNVPITGNPAIYGGTTNPTDYSKPSIASGTKIALTAPAVSGYNFTGWTGDCSGTNPCRVTMDANKNVTANYTVPVAQPDLISVNLTSSGIQEVGRTMTFSGNVQNIGGADASSSTARFCIDNPNCLTDKTRMVGDEIRVGIIAASDISETLNPTEFWTVTSEGEHAIYLCADAYMGSGDGDVTESIETNNCSSVEFEVVNPPAGNNSPIADAKITNSSSDPGCSMDPEGSIVDEGYAAWLWGSCSYDLDGNVVNYDWDCVPNDMTVNDFADIVINTPAVTDTTNYTCTLTVTDDKGGIGIDSVLLTVNNVLATDFNLELINPIINGGPTNFLLEPTNEYSRDFVSTDKAVFRNGFGGPVNGFAEQLKPCKRENVHKWGVYSTCLVEEPPVSIGQNVNFNPGAITMTEGITDVTLRGNNGYYNNLANNYRGKWFSFGISGNGSPGTKYSAPRTLFKINEKPVAVLNTSIVGKTVSIGEGGSFDPDKADVLLNTNNFTGLAGKKFAGKERMLAAVKFDYSDRWLPVKGSSDQDEQFDKCYINPEPYDYDTNPQVITFADNYCNQIIPASNPPVLGDSNWSYSYPEDFTGDKTVLYVMFDDLLAYGSVTQVVKVVDPKKLEVSLDAEPDNLSCAPSSYSEEVTLKATRLASSNTSGSITYEFDCDGGMGEDIAGDDFYKCTYTGNSDMNWNPKVQVKQESIEADADAFVSIKVVGECPVANTICNGDPVTLCEGKPSKKICPGTKVCSGDWKEVPPQ